jgi:hypothetical protein
MKGSGKETVELFKNAVLQGLKPGFSLKNRKT